MAKRRHDRSNDEQLRNLKRYEPSFEEDDEISINFSEILNLLKTKFYIPLLLIIVFGIGSGAYTHFMIPNTYASSGTIFLTPIITESGTADYASLNSNSKLVNNVITLLTQNNIMTRVAEETGLNSANEVKRCLSISNVKDTEVIVVRAVTQDPKLSKAIAKNTIDIFIDTMQENLNVKNIEIVDSPRLTYSPVGPNLIKNTAYGAAFGLALGAAYIFLLLITDNHLKNKGEAERYIGIPVLCEIPEFDNKKDEKKGK